MDFFFGPAGCAVVGASRDPAKPGHQMLRSMLDAGFPPERLFPVNPGLTAPSGAGAGRTGGSTGDEIAGLPAYSDLSSIPAKVELAVVMVPPAALDAVLADVAARAGGRGDLKGLIVTAGGYAELGTPEGRERQGKLVRAAREAGVRLMGPNCIGVIDTRSHMDTTFLQGVIPRQGSISCVSQSGALGAWFLQMLSAEPEPVGFSKFISLGNMADVTMAETVDYLRRDPSTGVVGLYLEGTSDPRPLLASIARLAADKPVVVLKTGRTESGRAAATSHTGALAGADRIWDGALRQAGALRAERMDEFVDTLRVLAARAGAQSAPVQASRRPAPPVAPSSGPDSPLRVFLVTHAGGPGVYTMDLLAAHPRELVAAVVTPETKAALAATVPPMSSVCRPEGHVDMTASATPFQHAEVVKLLLRDPGVDALVTLDLPIRFLAEEAVAEALAGAWLEATATGGVASSGKTFLPVLMHGRWSAEGRALLERSGLCALGSPDRAVAALANLARLVKVRPQAGSAGEPAQAGDDLGAATPPAPPACDGARPSGPGATLNEAESAALFSELGVDFAPSRLVRTREDVLAAARSIGYPVALKICSRAIPHKIAAGAARLGLRNPEELAGAYAELAARAMELLGHETDFLVQAWARAGAEVIVGGLRDSLFGPVVAVGVGGTRVGREAALRFRLAPLSEGEALRLAEELVEDLAPGPVGEKAAEPVATLDLVALSGPILAMSRLLSSRADVVEADLNPVIVYRAGEGAVAVDALVRLAGG